MSDKEFKCIEEKRCCLIKIQIYKKEQKLTDKTNLN